MPLTSKGEEIMSSMKETYGSEKGESVFYASKNAGKISGVDSAADPGVPERGTPNSAFPALPENKGEGEAPHMPSDADPLAAAAPATVLEKPEEHSLQEAPKAAPHIPIPDAWGDASPLESHLPTNLDTGEAGRSRWQIWEK